MNRRDFLTLSATGIIGLGASSFPLPLFAKGSGGKSYSMIILGDTHFDADPPSIYHAHYNEPNERLNKIQRGEFARNGEMWKDRCPRLLRRAAGLIDKDTRMVLQMGDLIQGDCGDGEVHKKMLSDVMNRFKQELVVPETDTPALRHRSGQPRHPWHRCPRGLPLLHASTHVRGTGQKHQQDDLCLQRGR